MAGLVYDRQQIEEVIDHIVERTMRMDLTWEWPCGVAYYGISRAYEVTGKKEYLQVMKDRVDKLIELGLPKPWTVNTCAMGHCLMTLYEATGDERYWEIIMSKVEYLRNDALRFGDNVLQHTVSAKNDFPEQCWADTLFMAASFLLRVGVKMKDQDIIHDALNQYCWHIHYLQDLNTGLWYHGYNNITKDHMSGFFWGRANCWAIFTMTQVQYILPGRWVYPEYLEILGSIDEHMSALKLYQTENGLWRTILDDPESYEEVSASAGIAAALAAHGNPLHYEHVNRAIKGVLANVTPEGRVTNVSGGTAIMNDRKGYMGIPRKWIQGWGQGMALAFFAQVLDEKRPE